MLPVQAFPAASAALTTFAALAAVAPSSPSIPATVAPVASSLATPEHVAARLAAFGFLPAVCNTPLVNQHVADRETWWAGIDGGRSGRGGR